MSLVDVVRERHLWLIDSSPLFFLTADRTLGFIIPYFDDKMDTHFNDIYGQRQPATAPRLIVLIRRSVDREWSGHVSGRIDDWLAPVHDCILLISV